MELARRHGDFAIAGVAFDLEMARGAVADGRLAYFGSEDKPTLARNVSGLALVGEGEWWLFDCGEGTQMRIMRATAGATLVP